MLRIGIVIRELRRLKENDIAPLLAYAQSCGDVTEAQEAFNEGRLETALKLIQRALVAECP